MNAVSTEFPIALIAVNENGHGNPSNYESTGDLGILPVLEDTADADVWGLWEVTYRDVIILNPCGEKAGVYNLSTHNLSDAADYAELKQLLLDAANPQ